MTPGHHRGFTVYLSGTDGHQGNVLAHTFLAKVNKLILVLNRPERVHEDSAVKKTDFEIVGAEKQKPTTLTLKPVPRVRNYNPSRAMSWSIEQLEVIDRGHDPDQRIGSGILGDIAEMSAESKDGGHKAFWINGHADPVHFDADFHLKALNLARKRAFAETPVVWHTGKSIGEVIGELKKVDDLDADNEVVLVPATGPDFIRCTFPESMKNEIGKFLFKKVKVKGVLSYDSLSPHPKRVQILDDGIEMYPVVRAATNFLEMRGMFIGRKRQSVDWSDFQMAVKKKYYWDACIFYEWLGKENIRRERSDGIREVLASVDAQESIIITLVATHLEVLSQKMHEKDDAAEQSYLALFDAEKFFEYQITTNVVLLAREIRDFYYRPAVPAVPKTKTKPAQPGTPAKMMDMGDCIHLATAIIEKVDEFHTRDESSKKGKIPLLGLYDFSGLPTICGKHPLTFVSPIGIQGTLDVDLPKK